MAFVPHQPIPSEVQECISDCQECGSICQETINYCLQMGGKHVEANHLRLLIDCAEICQASQNSMLHRSQFEGAICGVCAQVCQHCAESCAEFTGDSQMQACAASCRRCAASCRRMAEKMPAAAAAM